MNCTLDNQANFSRIDLSRRIKIPNKLTPKLAELTGIIAGDGHIYFNNQKRKQMYCIWISGSISEDSVYYKNRINKIFYNLFNLNFTFSTQRRDELIVRIYSKAITSFFKDIGIKTGNKTARNYIPSKILISDDNIKIGFLRGIFDTEFSIMFKKDCHGKHSRPILSLRMKSFKFISQLKSLLKYFDFTIVFYKDKFFDKRSKKFNIGYKLELGGKKNLKKFTELIGFRNPKHLTKIEIWKRFGFYPPRLSYQQRLNILNGKIDVNQFYR